jgi:hypothetical protein
MQNEPLRQAVAHSVGCQAAHSSTVFFLHADSLFSQKLPGHGWRMMLALSPVAACLFQHMWAFIWLLLPDDWSMYVM